MAKPSELRWAPSVAFAVLLTVATVPPWALYVQEDRSTWDSDLTGVGVLVAAAFPVVMYLPAILLAVVRAADIGNLLLASLAVVIGVGAFYAVGWLAALTTEWLAIAMLLVPVVTAVVVAEITRFGQRRLASNWGD
ncbi:MAG: hypothetical protein ACI9C1_003435 [Candidatus Aldehydirespiratoraceae bacterium]|jgi:hypothetical protein